MGSLHVENAAFHPNPYLFYDALLAGPPLVHDPARAVWIAARADVVVQLMSAPECGVRPQKAPVPGRLLGTAAEPLLLQLARFRDGARHAALRALACTRVDTLERTPLDAYVEDEVTDWEHEATRSLDGLLFRLPTRSLGRALGLSESALSELPGDVEKLLACIAPRVPEHAWVDAAAAAARLWALPLLSGEAEDVRASALGLLVQAHHATAGLIGNALVALSRSALAGTQDVDALLGHVLAHDPPVHNTRRYLRAPLRVEGIELAEDAVVVLMLAAAQRDRTAEAHGAFGAGPHRCPGSAIAHTIARAALRCIMRALGTSLPRVKAYRPYPNVRIPLFAATPEVQA